MSVVTTNPAYDTAVSETPDGRKIERYDGPKEMGKDAFLKLLITQLQNQDPLNPMEGVEMTQQLAEFTSLENLVEMNEKFTSLNTALNAQNQFHVINLVGKDIKAYSTKMSLTDGEASGGVFIIEETADVKIHIYNESSTRIRTLDLGDTLPGEHNIEWDGRDESGSIAKDGVYSFVVSAADKNNEKVESISHIQGTVDGVTFDGQGVPTLLMNGIKISIGEVMQIMQPQPEESEES